MIRFETNAGDLAQGLDTISKVTLPEALDEEAENIARIITNSTRKHIPSSHRLAEGQRKKSTGRLWSSFGIPIKRTNNPDYDPEDAIVQIKTSRGSANVEVVVGTKVRYARYANYGIGPGTRTAYYFVEKGLQESEDIIKGVLEEKIAAVIDPEEATSLKKSFLARRQEKDILGRFGHVLTLQEGVRR